ncbi:MULTISPECIES: calcium-binding protein [Cyanophyceae]|uniref:calcium-binding protein n=1 Tax=Cyanophyceae TaxID=3028117 RepID=UPI00168410DA|nr:calcium-binding protein [Trichocoleus sp. FACHB-69]MBD1930287.1 calcium-binding protein [Trichocoleus sp. FACHB-69]
MDTFDTISPSMATINGTNGNDPALNGTNGDDIINGLAGNDFLFGGLGNDILNGGTGSDRMEGGAGSDTYIVDGTDVIDEKAPNDSNSFDTVQSSITWTLGANLEKLVLTGNSAINGTGNDLNNQIYGNSASNSLFGGFGDDLLNGGAGADRMEGGAGSDTYIVDNIGDQIIEQFSNPSNQNDSDLVESSITWTLGAGLERLYLTGNAAINGTGNDLANGLGGNNANNTLIGGAGDDRLGGGGGSDILDGGADNDTYYMTDTNDTIIEAADGGIDTVETLVSYTLGANLENLTMLGDLGTALDGRGNELNNTITGANYNTNTLRGKAGHDTLMGGLVNDTLVGGAGSDTLTGGTGADKFYFHGKSSAVDRITDFSVADDTIGIATRSGSMFANAGLTVGAAITASQFRIGASAGDAGDRFIYNSTTGGLFFDKDGIGGTAQVQFATLSTGLAMTNADVLVFA